MLCIHVYVHVLVCAYVCVHVCTFVCMCVHFDCCCVFLIQSGDQCMDTISNSLDEFRDLFEIYLGLHFTVGDLLDIRSELSS